jgi:hypothetical protein
MNDVRACKMCVPARCACLQDVRRMNDLKNA